MPKKLFLIFPIFLLLTACNQSDKPSEQASAGNKADFVGCYSVEKGSPAQLQIINQDGYFMQMKEPDGSWDKPEPMPVPDDDKAWEFFKINALDLHQKDIIATIARQDDVMAMASLNTAVSSLNPHLDSPYVMSLFGSVNTVYKVECDNVGMDLVKEAENYHPSQLPTPPAQGGK